MTDTITGFAHLDKIADEIGDEAGTCDADYAFQKAAALMIYNLRTALEAAEARAEKAESDKTALEEDLEATEKNLKESSGFIEELLSGLKHRFPVQYADLEGDEYGDDAFSSHDLLELVIDPAVNAAQEAARRAVAAGEGE